VSVVLAHGAWADGSSWSKVIVAHSVDHMPLVMHRRLWWTSFCRRSMTTIAERAFK